jgi:phosphoenolpyruvate carboxylase
MVAVVEHGFKYTDPLVLRAYVALLDPDTWLACGAAAETPAAQDAHRAVADLCERHDLHEGLERILRVLVRDHMDLARALRQHRRLQRAQGEVPIAVDRATRDNMHLLHAVRLACMLRICQLAVRVPDFSDRYEMTREDVLVHLLHLDVDTGTGLLRKIFPYEEVPVPALDWGETATYADGDGTSYRPEHERLFAPLDRLADRIRRVSAILVHHLGAVG